MKSFNDYLVITYGNSDRQLEETAGVVFSSSFVISIRSNAPIHPPTTQHKKTLLDPAKKPNHVPINELKKTIIYFNCSLIIFSRLLPRRAEVHSYKLLFSHIDTLYNFT